MKFFKQTIISLLVVFMMITSLSVVRADDGEIPDSTESTAMEEGTAREEKTPAAEPEITVIKETLEREGETGTLEATEEGSAPDEEIPPFTPAPILNPPVDYSVNLTIDEHTNISGGELLNSRLRRKLEEDIDTVLNFQPIDSDDIGRVLYAVDNFLTNGGYEKTSSDVGAVLLSSGDLGQMANAIGLEETGEDLVEVVDSGDNATGYIFVIDRDSVAVRVENSKGEGIGNALVSISYKNKDGETVNRAQYTTDGQLPGLTAFDKMSDVSYILIDVQAADYRAQTILDQQVTTGDMLYFQLEDSPADDVYLRCVDMGGKNMLTDDSNLYLVESGSRPLDMRVIVTAKGSKSLPDKITLKDDHTERSVTDFTNYSRIELGGTVSRMFSRSEDWMKKGGLLKEDDVLYFDVSGNSYLLPHVRVYNALMQPGTSEEELPLTGTDKDIPYTDVMGGSGIVSLTIKYFKVPVTIGVFPEGGFIIVATFDIDSLSTKYSSLFEESWNPKTREAGESIFEPFKQEFWRKSDRFKSGTGQMNDSKRATVVKDKNWSFNVAFSLFCTGVYNKNTGNFDGSFGGIFDIKVGGGVIWYVLISTPIVIPVYAGFNISGEFKGAMTANFVWNKLSDGIGAAFSAADHTLVERYDLIAAFELFGGLGLKGACAIEGAGAATMDFALIKGTVEEDARGRDGTRFLIDSFASVRITGYIAFFSFNLFNKSFGPWRLHDTHPDKITEPPTLPEEVEEAEFLDLDLEAVSEKGTLLLAGNGEDQMNHYKMNLLNSEIQTVNDIQTIKAISNDTFANSQIQIASTGKTTALFRIASIDGKARIVYQKQDPDTGEFMDDYYELPAFMGYDVTEFNVSASTTDLNYFYVGAIVADSSKPDIQSRSLTTRVQGIVIDMDNDRVRKSEVRSPLPDAGKYFYFNPRIAGRGDEMAVAYQRTYTYKYLGDADACVFGTNLKETVIGKGNVFTSGDIVPGEPSFFLTNRTHTTRDTVVIDGYMADGSFDEKNPRCRYSVSVKDYVLEENENFLTNWGYANNTNYAIIASKLYFLEKYADSYDAYGYGMRLKEVENSEGLVNRDNIYEFVVTDDKSGICLVSTTSNYEANMETGENILKGSTLRVHTLEGRYDESTKTNQAILHGPLEIFVKDADINVFAAVFNRENCRSKGLSVVYSTTPDRSLSASGKMIADSDIYQWQQNLKRGMIATNVEFADLFYYTYEKILPVFVTFQNVGYAIEGQVAFTVKDENGYDMHELYYNPGNHEWYDLGNEVDHNIGRVYSGDTVTMELIVAAPYYWESGRVHEVHVEISPKYRGDVRATLTTPVFRNSLTLRGRQIVLGEKHYADLSITNISDQDLSLNKLAVEIMYTDDAKQSRVSLVDLTKVDSNPDLDKYSVRYDLTPIWERAEADGVLAVRFMLVDRDGMPVTGENVIMTPNVLQTLQDVSYEITEGADGVWTKGSDTDHLIKVVRSRNEETCFSHFTDVSIDGKVLTLDNDYLAESGSTLITLKKEMMEQLSEGKHDVVITFDDGEVETTLEIKDGGEEIPDDPTPVDPTPVDPGSPDTGDVNNLRYWFVMLLTSVMAVLRLILRKRPYNR